MPLGGKDCRNEIKRNGTERRVFEGKGKGKGKELSIHILRVRKLQETMAIKK